MTLLQIGGFGPQELIIILLIAVLLFGANKIPKLARSTGQALGEFQKGREEIEQELETIKDGASLDTGATSTDAASEASGASEETSTSEETA